MNSRTLTHSRITCGTPVARSGDVLVVTPRGVGDPASYRYPHSRIGPLAATARISSHSTERQPGDP